MVIIRAQATGGRAPEWFSLAPIDAVRKVVAKAGWSLDSVDLFELNEAFSVQALAVIRELGLDPARVNVNGGAVALGHPIGASGARFWSSWFMPWPIAERKEESPRSVSAVAARWPWLWSGCRLELRLADLCMIRNCPISDNLPRQRSLQLSSLQSLTVAKPFISNI